MSIYLEKNKKTKQLIQRSFLYILEAKAFDSITISDITKEANINRGTFYLHYQDKFDLLAQIENQLFEDLGNHISKLQESYLATLMMGKGQEQLASALFSFIELHARMLKVFLSDHGRAGFHIRFKQSFSNKVRSNLEKNETIISNLKVPMDFFLSFITSAFLGLIEQWIQNGLDKTPEEMTKLYIDIISFIQRR